MNYSVVEDQDTCIEQTSIFCYMQNCIFLYEVLIRIVFRNNGLITQLAHCIDKISINPKFTTPKSNLHHWMLLKDIFCCQAFHNGNDRPCKHFGNGLNHKMHMFFVSSNFHTNLILRFIYCLTKNFLAIYGRRDKMIQNYTISI